MRIRFSCVIKIPDIKPCISLGVSFLVDSPLYPLSIRWETLQIDIQEQFYCDCRTKQGIKIGIYMSKFNPNLAKPSTLSENEERIIGTYSIIHEGKENRKGQEGITFAVLNITFLQSGRMLTDHAGRKYEFPLNLTVPSEVLP